MQPKINLKKNTKKQKNLQSCVRSKGSEEPHDLQAQLFTSMIWGKLISLDVLIYQTGHNNIYHAFLMGLFGGSGVLKMA